MKKIRFLVTLLFTGFAFSTCHLDKSECNCNVNKFHNNHKLYYIHKYFKNNSLYRLELFSLDLSSLDQIKECSDSLVELELHYSNIKEFCVDSTISIEEVDIKGSNIQTPAICEYFNSKELNISESYISQGYVSISSQRLEAIRIWDCNLQKISFGYLPKLRILDLSDNKDLEEINHYSNIANVQKLNISGTDIEKIPIDSMPKLKELYVDSGFYYNNQHLANVNIEMIVKPLFVLKW